MNQAGKSLKRDELRARALPGPDVADATQGADVFTAVDYV